MVGSYNEFPQLAECGMQIDSTHIMRFADYGYNLPEDGLYVTEEFYQKHPETITELSEPVSVAGTGRTSTRKRLLTCNGAGTIITI